MKILLVDDHTLFRAGMSHVLRQLDEDVQIFEAGSVAEARATLAAQPGLNLALLDLYMPDGHGSAALASITQQYPALPVVVLSGSDKREDMQRALDAGALGFIPKSVTPAVMLSALRLVLAGGVYVPAQLVQAPDTAGKAGSAPESGLTPRQIEVLAGVIEGKSNKAIAQQFGITEATVKAHISALFRALNVSNRTQAARAADALKIRF